MSPRQLLEWQWQGYATYHQHRTNLLLHIVAVPLFMLASLSVVVGVLALSLPWLIAGIAGIVLAVAIQGRGHKLEPVPPEPFAGPLNFAARLFLEQWVTFPRFVLSGRWGINFARARDT